MDLIKLNFIGRNLHVVYLARIDFFCLNTKLVCNSLTLLSLKTSYQAITFLEYFNVALHV